MRRLLMVRPVPRVLCPADGLLGVLSLCMILGATLSTDGRAEQRPRLKPAKTAPTEVAGCQSRWREQELGRTAAESPAIKAYLQATPKKTDPEKAVALAARNWTTDFIVGAALDLEQRTLSVCEDPRLSKLLSALQATYLRRMGWTGPVGEAQLLFRGLVSVGEEFEVLKNALAEERTPALSSLEPLKALAQVHGAAELIDGVLVVGAAPLPKDEMVAVARDACSGKPDCLLWDPAFVQRVTLVPSPGVAAYTPETGLLKLSRVLVEDYKLLHQMVVLHELAHSAAVRQKKRTGDDWVEVFARFSDWSRADTGWTTPIRTVEGDWRDELLAQSQGSAFSILPDPPMPAIGNDEQLIDGFVMARSERETRRSGDPVEDFADHVAAYLVASHRFCYRSKPVAPRKYEWIARELFGQERKLVCAPWP